MSLCPGCANPVSEQERLTGVCAKDGLPLDRGTTCKHCKAPIVYETALKLPGYLPRAGWSDGRPHPFYCGSALNLTHEPEEV